MGNTMNFNVNSPEFVEGTFFAPFTMGQVGVFTIRLDKEGLAIAKDVSSLIQRVAKMPKSNSTDAQEKLRNIDHAVFTALAVADKLPHNNAAGYYPWASELSQCIEFLDLAIPDLINTCDLGWKAERMLRKGINRVLAYAFRFILDAMTTTLREIEDEEIEDEEFNWLNRLFLKTDVSIIGSVGVFVPYDQREKLAKLKEACSQMTP